MAAIDKIWGTQIQYNEFKKWLIENEKPVKIAYDYDLVPVKGILHKRNITYKEVMPINYLYPSKGYCKKNRPISHFPIEIDKWLLKKCPIKWVVLAIKEQHGLI